MRISRPRIFINYRRSISRYSASIVHRFCVERFGANFVFFDSSTLCAGDKFPADIERAIDQCEVLLAIIGPEWDSVADETGSRLRQRADWVRQEIASVLRRNRKTPVGEPAPVLIIPLIEADGADISKVKLPASIASLRAINSVNFREARDLEQIVVRIEEHLGTPPMGDFGVRVVSQLPDFSRRGQHRFRYVKSERDLSVFVELSDAETAIAGANPGLEGEARMDLYRRWCQWTARTEERRWDEPGNEVKTFLLLEQLQPDGLWTPIAVSILLPLTRQGARHLRLFRQSDLIFDLKRNAATLTGSDLAREPTDRLLVDTWIVRRIGNATIPLTRGARFQHYGWGVALVLRHVAEFWTKDSGRPIAFLSEPDNPKIAKMLNDLRFLEENRNSASGNIFVLRYPLDEDKYGPEDEAWIEAIFRLMRTVAKIAIV